MSTLEYLGKVDCTVVSRSEIQANMPNTYHLSVQHTVTQFSV